MCVRTVQLHRKQTERKRSHTSLGTNEQRMIGPAFHIQVAKLVSICIQGSAATLCTISLKTNTRFLQNTDRDSSVVKRVIEACNSTVQRKPIFLTCSQGFGTERKHSSRGKAAGDVNSVAVATDLPFESEPRIPPTARSVAAVTIRVCVCIGVFVVSRLPTRNRRKYPSLCRGDPGFHIAPWFPNQRRPLGSFDVLPSSRFRARLVSSRSVAQDHATLLRL